MALSDSFSGGLRAAAAMTVLGCSAGVTALLAGFPSAGGQAVRYVLAAALLLPLARRAGGPRPRLDRREVLLLLALAAVGLYAFNLLMVTALRHTEPAVVGSVLGCAPLLMGVVGPLLERRRPQARLLLAGVAVVAGAAVTQGFGSGDPVGLVCAVGTLLCEVGFSLLAVPLLPRLGAVRVSAYATALAVPMFVVTALVLDGRAALRLPSGAELFALLYLGAVLTCGAFLLWYGALGRLGAERAGLFAGLVPVSAALSGAVLGAGVPHPAALAGSALVGLGVGVGLTGPDPRVRKRQSAYAAG
ncbi:DMT family transporter [Kitasatospora sp. NPDC048365]|uniref:DMT family transporter n=1 Tax=Kitasatospora sp. NPDC048365 TaxID=3364050 RepID=UPI0037230B74